MKQETIFKKQLRKSEYLHLFCDRKKQTLPIRDVLAYHGKQLSILEEEPRQRFIERIKNYKQYLQDTTNGSCEHVVALVTGSERFKVENASLLGIFYRGVQIDALEDIAVQILQGTLSTKKRSLGVDEAISLQGSYARLNGLLEEYK